MYKACTRRAFLKVASAFDRDWLLGGFALGLPEIENDKEIFTTDEYQQLYHLGSTQNLYQSITFGC